MEEWLGASTQLNEPEQYIFDDILYTAKQQIEAWAEEDLKMNFISFVLKLGKMNAEKQITTFFDKIISAKVEGYFLKTKIDFLMAKGILDLLQAPYFHFQEYKKQIAQNDNPMAQLVEAMLIAQEMNQNGKPIFGCSVIGKFWDFVTMEGKTYCVSKSYDSTERDELLQIIANLRKIQRNHANKIIMIYAILLYFKQLMEELYQQI